MGNSPDDMKRYRTRIMTVAGVTDPAAFGIAPDARHKADGGPHCGKGDLVAIGRYHPPASSHIGSSTEDYSARTQRDRAGLTESSSAIDQTLEWRNGGRAAALRNNTLLAQQLRAGDPALNAIKAVNYSIDGSVAGRRRIERANGWKPQSSGDNTEIHTHIERYRDTEGTATWQATADRLIQIAEAAVANRPLTPSAPLTPPEEPSMSSWNEPITQGAPGIAGQQRDTVLARAQEFAANAARDAAAGLAEAKAARIAVEALAAVINSGDGNVDTAQIKAHMDQLAQAEIERDNALRAELLASEARADELEAKLAAAYAEASQSPGTGSA